MALLILALIVGLAFSLLSLLLVRNSPESCGLLADGHSDNGTDEARWSVPDINVTEAKRSPVFWIYASALGLYSLFGTALVFHIVSIFNEAGRDENAAIGYFLPAAIVSVLINLLGSWVSDYWPLKRLLLIKLCGFAIGTWGILHLQYDWGYWMLVTGFGTASGLWGVLSNLAYIRFFRQIVPW